MAKKHRGIADMRSENHDSDLSWQILTSQSYAQTHGNAAAIFYVQKFNCTSLAW